jgi:hypothetical protein
MGPDIAPRYRYRPRYPVGPAQCIDEVLGRAQPAVCTSSPPWTEGGNIHESGGFLTDARAGSGPVATCVVPSGHSRNGLLARPGNAFCQRWNEFTCQADGAGEGDHNAFVRGDTVRYQTMDAVEFCDV